MATRKKVTRKELLKEEDEFLAFSQKLLQRAIQFRTYIAWGAAVFFALVVVTAGYRLISNRAENTAFALLESAAASYQQQVRALGPEKAREAVAADFERILKKYPGRTAGKMARIMFAEISYHGGDPDTAIRLYRKALDDVATYPVLKGQVLSGLGYAHEAKKDYATAIAFFEEVVSGSGYILQDEALFQMGRLYAMQGQQDRSLSAFKRIAEDYPESMYAAIAREKTSGS